MFLRRVHQLTVLRPGCRTFLSPAYKCTPAWEARLTSPTLAKISVDQFYADVETKFQQQRKVSAIDVDIFVNTLTSDNYVDEMADLVHKLRMTEEASSILDSTSHALIRNLMEHDHIDLLLHILRDPLNYGIFLDTFTANILLDKLVEEKRFAAAAEVASFLMLQEDFGDDITKALSLLATIRYLENPVEFSKLEDPAAEAAKAAAASAAAAAPTPAKGKKGKAKEELRVRVKFLRNPYFDDHFDLKSPRHLVGKTLLQLSAELPAKYQLSCQLLGLCLYEKFAECQAQMDKLTGENVIYKEIWDRIQTDLEAHPHESEEYKSVVEKFKSIASAVRVVEDPLHTEVEQMIKSAAAQSESATVTGQTQVYSQWVALRDERLQDELLRLKRAASVKEFEQMTKEMEMEEKKLWFFENEEQIELEIESKEVRYPKRWFGKKKKPRVVDEGYVPPEIKTVRNW